MWIEKKLQKDILMVSNSDFGVYIGVAQGDGETFGSRRRKSFIANHQSLGWLSSSLSFVIRTLHTLSSLGFCIPNISTVLATTEDYRRVDSDINSRVIL